MGCGLSEFFEKLINETIKIMKKIEEVIDTHGGWLIKKTEEIAIVEGEHE